MVVMRTTECLGQILEIWELAVLRGVCEVRRKLAELARRRRIAVRLGRLNGGLQVGGNLLCDLLILTRIRVLKLLELLDQLCER